MPKAVNDNWLYKRAFLLGAVVLLLLCVAFELYNGTTISDSSVFRYMGWRLSQGDGYSAAWDHKGPVLVALNALGYILFPTQNFGPTIIFGALWIVTALALGRLASYITNGNKIIGSLAGLIFVFLGVGDGGGAFLNCQEIVGCVLASWGVYLILTQNGFLASVVFGMLVGGAFMVKPTLVGFGGAAIVWWIGEAIKERQIKQLWIRGVGSFIGFATVIITITVLYIPLGVAEMWDAVLGFNLFEYTSCGAGRIAFWSKYFSNEWSLFKSGGWKLPLFAVMLVAAIRSLVILEGKVSNAARNYLIIWLTIEAALAFSAQSFYTHYLIPSYLVIAIILAIGTMVDRWHVNKGVICLLILLNSLSLASGVRFTTARNKGTQEIVEWCKGNIAQGDPVASCGTMSVAELLGRARLKTPQKYFSWLLYQSYCAEERRRVMLDQFAATLADEKVQWLIMDLEVDSLFKKIPDLNEETRAAIGFFKLNKAGKGWYIYKKTNSYDE